MLQKTASVNGQLHVAVDWRSGIWAGLIAGLAFMMIEMGLVWLAQGESPWGPPHMIAAMALGDDILPPPGTWAPFDLGVITTAMMIHMVLSGLLGMLGALLLRGAGMGKALLFGAMFGIPVYVLTFYIIAPIAFPWFVTARNWVSAFSHIMFGVVFGIAYRALHQRRLA